LNQTVSDRVRLTDMLPRIPTDFREHAFSFCDLVAWNSMLESLRQTNIKL